MKVNNHKVNNHKVVRIWTYDDKVAVLCPKDGNIAVKQADFDWNWTQNSKMKLLCPKIKCILDINGIENQNMSNGK